MSSATERKPTDAGSLLTGSGSRNADVVIPPGQINLRRNK